MSDNRLTVEVDNPSPNGSTAVRSRTLPLPWLLGLSLCTVLGITVPASLYLSARLDESTAMVERSLIQANESEDATDALAHQIYPVHALELAASEFAHETELVMLDPDRGTQLLRQTSQVLHEAASELPGDSLQSLSTQEAERFKGAVGTLLDIATDALATERPRQRQQLLNEMRNSIGEVRSAIKSLSNNVARQRENTVHKAMQSARSSRDAISRQRVDSQELQLQAEIVLALLVLLFGATITVIYWVISMRLRKVSRYSRKVADGDYHAKLQLDCQDAIGLVVRDVSRMGQKLANEVIETAHQARLANLANRSKSEFLANMSHEIRTPLNGILGMNEVLLKTGLNEKQRRCVGAVRRSAESLLRVINDILDFSKIEAGKMELDATPFDLVDLVEDIPLLLGETARNKGLDLVCALPATLHRNYRGDAGRIRQILFNLVGNAIKFTDAGEVRLDVIELPRRGAALASRLRFSVRDTGIGIPEDAQRHIFKSFAQASASTSQTYGGTGLGLTISAQLVELMGGEMGVDSETGKGSEFWFTIKLKKDLEAGADADNRRKQPDSHAVDTVPASTDQTHLKGRVLLVEDNVVNQEIVLEFLSATGLQIDVREDGAAAAQACADTAYALVLMDCHLPVLDGLQATQSIRAAERGTRAPIVALTANALSGDRERCLAAGMDDFLSKPFTESDLFEVLSRWLPEDDAPAADPLAASIPVPGDAAGVAVDVAVLDRFRGRERNGTPVLTRIIDAYLDGSAAQVAQLHEAVEAGDAPAVHFAAHSLKSSSASVGAVRLSELCRRMEGQASEGGDVTGLVGIVAELRSLHGTVCDVLEGERPTSRDQKKLRA